jgi:hypothetical protein
MKKVKLSPDDYQNLKEFLGVFFDKFFPQVSLSPDQHPLALLETLERSSLAQAQKGLEMTINDCVELSSDWSAEQVSAADAELKSRGLIPLTEVRRRYSRKYFQVLKRGRIKSEQEYYLLKGIASGGSIEAGAIEVVQIESMLEQYEKLVAGGT